MQNLKNVHTLLILVNLSMHKIKLTKKKYFESPLTCWNAFSQRVWCPQGRCLDAGEECLIQGIGAILPFLELNRTSHPYRFNTLMNVIIINKYGIQYM